MRRTVALLVAPLLAASMVGCSTGYVSGDYHDPQDYEYSLDVEPPTQAEIDRSFEHGLAEAEAELRKSGQLQNTTCVDLTTIDSSVCDPPTEHP